MTSFGEFLRHYRKKCAVPAEPDRKLSQEQLGELIGAQLGLKGGYSGAAVSDWERGVSKIQADQRPLLISPLKVLRETGGLESPTEANELLEAGNYRSLNQAEIQEIFPEFSKTGNQLNGPDSGDDNKRWVALFINIVNVFTRSEPLPASAGSGAPPTNSWAHTFTGILNYLFTRWSIFQWLRLILWLWVLLICRYLLLPSLHWPFDNQAGAQMALVQYTAGSLIVPLLVGCLTNTKNDRFWKNTDLGNTPLTRLYTYQGASIGFHIGYFCIFALFLIGFQLRLQTIGWLEFAALTFVLGFSYAAARLVPENLLRAFGKLGLSDGGVFFISVALGPLWALSFFLMYPLLLTPFTGIIILLLAITALTVIMAWQYHRAGNTIIPVHWWVIIYGSFLILYEISATRNIFSVVALAGLIYSLGALLALGRIYLTLRGVLALLSCLLLCLLLLTYNRWISGVIGLAGIVLWLRWGKKYLSFSPSFAGILLAEATSAWVFKNQWLTDWQASLALACVIFVLVCLEFTL